MSKDYIKQVENHNYDLMKKLAETEEILEDYQSIHSSNEELLKNLIINAIDQMQSLVEVVQRSKLILSQYDIEEAFDKELSPSEEFHITTNGKVYVENFLESDHTYVGFDAHDLFMKHIDPQLTKVNPSEEAL